MILVLSIRPVNSKRRKIVIEGDAGCESCILYIGELRKLHIHEGAELDEVSWITYQKETLYKRALSRSLHLLTVRDYTKKSLIDKLIANGYTNMVVEETIVHLQELGYIDDVSFAKRYVDCYKDRKSKKKLQQELKRKGILSDQIAEILDQTEDMEESEDIALQKLVEKRCKNSNLKDSKEYQKQLAYLFRQGYTLEKCKEQLNQIKLQQVTIINQ